MRVTRYPHLLLLLALVAGLGATPLPHTELEESSPADGAVLSAPPESIRLLFNRAVDAGLATVTLQDPGGARHELEPENEDGEPRAVVSRTPDLAPGAWTVEWRVVADDGHPVTGSFGFRVEAPPEAEPVEGDTAAVTGESTAGATLPDGRAAAQGASPDPAGAGADAPTVLLRGLAGAALLGLAGLLAFAVLAGAGAGWRPSTPIRAAAWLAPPLLAGHLWLWWTDLVPAGRAALDPALLVSTTAGTLEMARVALTVLALGALVVARGPLLPALLAWGAVLAGAGLGHPLAVSPALAVPAKAVHLVAAGVWAGGLVHLLTLRPGTESFMPGVARVSASALWASVALAGSGVLMAVLFVERPGDLLATPYGLLLLGKVAGMAGLVALGARNRFRLVPRLPDREAAGALRRSVAAEVGLVTLVFLVAAALASTAPGG